MKLTTENLSNLERCSILFQYCTTDKIPKLPITFTFPNMELSDVERLC